MYVDELETIKHAVAVLESNGYNAAALALKGVLEREFAKIAESLEG